ncbi:hypothetical protein DFH09DRAFT_1310747 [Mycena vulgaris]|nr:hypothetical protein DFH09DRAFT_1310747 [Mycena vulgaris]
MPTYLYGVLNIRSEAGSVGVPAKVTVYVTSKDDVQLNTRLDELERQSRLFEAELGEMCSKFEAELDDMYSLVQAALDDLVFEERENDCAAAGLQLRWALSTHGDQAEKLYTAASLNVYVALKVVESHKRRLASCHATAHPPVSVRHLESLKADMALDVWQKIADKDWASPAQRPPWPMKSFAVNRPSSSLDVRAAPATSTGEAHVADVGVSWEVKCRGCIHIWLQLVVVIVRTATSPGDALFLDNALMGNS